MDKVEKGLKSADVDTFKTGSGYRFYINYPLSGNLKMKQRFKKIR